LFYTLEDDDENGLNLEWTFIQRDEIINALRIGTRFTDGEVDELIVIEEQKEEIDVYGLRKTTRELISKTIGLPFEMMQLIDENIEDFVLYKKGETMNYTRHIPNDKRIEEEKGPSLSKKIK